MSTSAVQSPAEKDPTQCEADVHICRAGISHKVIAPPPSPTGPFSMAARRRLSLEGPALLFVTTTVVEWLPVFRDHRAARIVLYQLKETLQYYRVGCVAYVLMLHHLHLLAGFPDYCLVTKFMQGFKILSSKRIKEMHNPYLRRRAERAGKYQLWKPRFDEVVIESDQQFDRKIRYIHENPVRAGLLASSINWPYSSASFWLEGKPGLIPIDTAFRWSGPADVAR